MRRRLPTRPAAAASRTWSTASIRRRPRSSSAIAALAARGGCTVGGAPVAGPIEFTSNVATLYASSPPGILAGVTSNSSGLALTAVGTGLNADGSFVATPSSGSALTCPIKTPALPLATVLPRPSLSGEERPGNLVKYWARDRHLHAGIRTQCRGARRGRPRCLRGAGTDPGQINDYRWIIEEDRTFYVDPKCQINSTDPALRPASCPPLPVQSLGYNFHTSYMPVVAAGCVGAVSCEAGQSFGGGTTAVACDVGNGACRAAAQKNRGRSEQRLPRSRQALLPLRSAR